MPRPPPSPRCWTPTAPPRSSTAIPTGPRRHAHGETVRWVLTDWDLDGRHPRAAVLRLGADGFTVLPQVD